MKRITDASAPTRGRVELLTGPDDRVLLKERLLPGVDNAARAIEYMNAQWHAMASTPMPPTGIRVTDDHGTVLVLSRGPIELNLIPGGFRRNGRIIVDNPKCEACVEGRHLDKPGWHTWADDALVTEQPELGITQRCSCECAGPRRLALHGEA